MGRQSWRVSFRSKDFREEPARSPDPVPQDAGRRCARGEYCSMRVITFVNGERVVTPARTPRPFCDLCQQHIGACLAEFPGLYDRLAAAIGDPMQADVMVRIPFGPQVPLREDIDAVMRAMTETLAGWHERTAAAARLARPDTQRSRRIPGRLALSEAVQVLVPHLSALLALEPASMLRYLPLPAIPGDALVLARDGWQALAVVDLGGEDAGQEILHLRYRARSVLLETNPPPELLIPPCPQCTWRTLRRAWPDADRDLYARCDHCGDEMTTEEYDVNAKRWLAYHKASAENAPVLAETPAA